jgi:uncharacterized membrane protein
LLLYTTINQMRPVEIIEAIHDHVLSARQRQEKFLTRTRRTSHVTGPSRACVSASRDGFVTAIDLNALEQVLSASSSQTEVILLVSFGSNVAFQTPVAEIKTDAAEEVEKISEAIHRAVRLERQRDILVDPAYGIEQLEMIGWTSISTAKSNPAPGLLTIYSLRDIYGRWFVREEEAGAAEEKEAALAVVYKDNTPAELLNAFETLAVVSSESMQHQNYIAVLDTFTGIFERLPNDKQKEIEDRILRILPALGDHVLTTELDAALTALITRPRQAQRGATAQAVQSARDTLAQSIGKLNSRATRVS